MILAGTAGAGVTVDLLWFDTGTATLTTDPGDSGGNSNCSGAFNTFTDSRCMRRSVDLGSIEYSAVTQPRSWSFNHGGIRSSTVAVQSTRVSPKEQSTDPSAHFVKFVVSSIGRNSLGSRPSCRIGQGR